MKGKSLTKEDAQRELFENIELQTLGNHLLSYWRYWNHWAMADMDEAAYEYFIKCLDKMMDLARPGIPFEHEEYCQYFIEECDGGQDSREASRGRVRSQPEQGSVSETAHQGEVFGSGEGRLCRGWGNGFSHLLTGFVPKLLKPQVRIIIVCPSAGP